MNEYQSGKLNHSDLREIYKMNPDTIYKWIGKYELYGIEALKKYLVAFFNTEDTVLALHNVSLQAKG